MEKLKVENAVIGKQFENSSNYMEFFKIAIEKKIEVSTVEAGEKINIENNFYFDILWPSSKNKITSNVLNNNSLVCKLVYKDFKVLFTGDIEEIAEKEILELYENNLNVLKADILKIAHHGSKTSSTKEFLEAVSPKVALIGVRKR